MIWLVGSKGMLGRKVEALLQAEGLSFKATDIELDITKPEDTAGFSKALSRREDPLKWIINCSAYTAVDAAEDEPEKAFAVNAIGPRNLAIAAKNANAALLHISTDYVFDGFKESPYVEDDPPNPLSVYGKSKLEGEREVTAILERHVILRTAWLYAGSGKNFVTTMLGLFKSRDTVSVVEDQWGSPTYAGDLAAAILAVVRREAAAPGIYHFTNEGRTNWFQFAREIHAAAAERGLVPKSTRIVPLTTAQYPAKARRPAHAYLSKDKFKTSFQLDIRPWQASLKACFDEEISPA